MEHHYIRRTAVEEALRIVNSLLCYRTLEAYM